MNIIQRCAEPYGENKAAVVWAYLDTVDTVEELRQAVEMLKACVPYLTSNMRVMVQEFLEKE